MAGTVISGAAMPAVLRLLPCSVRGAARTAARTAQHACCEVAHSPATLRGSPTLLGAPGCLYSGCLGRNVQPRLKPSCCPSSGGPGRIDKRMPSALLHSCSMACQVVILGRATSQLGQRQNHGQPCHRDVWAGQRAPNFGLRREGRAPSGAAPACAACAWGGWTGKRAPASPSPTRAGAPQTARARRPWRLPCLQSTGASHAGHV